MSDEPSVTSTIDSNTATVVGAGSLDLHIGDLLRNALEEASATGKTVVIDFRDVSYMDTAVAAALVATARRHLDVDRRVKVIVAEKSHPQYVLKIMGLATLMDIEVR